MAYRAAKQARRFEGRSQRDFNNKLASYLARRGFSYDIIKDVVAKVWEEQQGQADE
jgi:SOS response regulatory protein OraA/RecX